ncbi:hypothetical protein COB55_01465 [Candidatus Wolfebacteria bacterium]|nr:MAG: hypothetical protein COB55_01465 [Candidatus Wolfebacteria bacterium]
MRNIQHNMKRGFTVVEILVAILVFFTVVGVSMGALLAIVNANTKAQAVSNIMNNLNFAVDAMTRDFRLGTDYLCGGTGIELPDCSEGNSAVTVTTQKGIRTTYQLTGGKIYKEFGITSRPVSGDDVVITKLTFFVAGAAAAPSDAVQPRIVIIIDGHTSSFQAGVQTSFHIQTTASQRIFDKENS